MVLMDEEKEKKTGRSEDNMKGVVASVLESISIIFIIHIVIELLLLLLAPKDGDHALGTLSHQLTTTTDSFLVPYKSPYTPSFTSKQEEQYAIIIDAGSTGSRLFVYRLFYDHENPSGMRRDIERVSSAKALPGLSAFQHDPQGVIANLQPLFDHATGVVPPNYHPHTPVYLQATAGMRLVPDEIKEEIYDTIYCQWGQDPSFPFQLERENIGTLPGTREGYYAALSVNYLKGYINSYLEVNEGEPGLIGALDMGGASTQIVFQHHEEHSGLNESNFWVQSYLAYGVDTIRYRLWEQLIQDAHTNSSSSTTTTSSSSLMEVMNPCGFVGHTADFKGYQLLGTGQADQCSLEIRRMLWQDSYETCTPDDPCGLDGIHHPPLNGHFLAMSVYFYALDCMKQLGPTDMPYWPSPSLDEIEEASRGFCEQSWGSNNSTATRLERHPMDHRLVHRCIEVVYIHTVLKHGFGFPGHARNISFVLDVKGMEVEWTLGFALELGIIQHEQSMQQVMVEAGGRDLLSAAS